MKNNVFCKIKILLTLSDLYSAFSYVSWNLTEIMSLSDKDKYLIKLHKKYDIRKEHIIFEDTLEKLYFPPSLYILWINHSKGKMQK